MDCIYTRPKIVLLPWPKKPIGENYLYSFQKCRCFYCDKFMDFSKFHKDKRPNGYTVDHVFPNSLGFTRAGNIVLACRKCNEVKANRLPTHDEIRQAIKLYHIMKKNFIACLRAW